MDDKGDFTVTIEPFPKSRKSDQVLKLFKIRYDKVRAEAMAAEGDATVKQAAKALPIFDPAYNVREVCKQLTLLEDHLLHPQKRCPDCIRKHLLTAEALAEEAVTLDVDRMYPSLVGLAEKIRVLWRAVHGGMDLSDVSLAARMLRKNLVPIAVRAKVAFDGHPYRRKQKVIVGPYDDGSYKAGVVWSNAELRETLDDKVLVKIRGEGIEWMDPDEIMAEDEWVQTHPEEPFSKVASPLQDSGQETWSDGTIWQMDVGKDQFVHFTPADRADEIVVSGKLLMRPPYKKFGGDAVYAISTVWGNFVPGTQTTHYGKVPLVAIVFKTSTVPKAGFSEEVTWDRDVVLKNAKIVPYNQAVNMVRNTPHAISGDDMVLYGSGRVARVAARYRQVSTRGVRLPSKIQQLFTRWEDVFTRYPNLWVKGGGARSVFLAWVRSRREPSVDFDPADARDVDLVVIGREPTKSDVVRAFEGKIQAQDVENIASISGYFGTRDLGINEVLLRPETLMFTDKALTDTLRNVTHPSGFEGGPDMSPRVALRAVLMALREGMEPSPAVFPALADARPFDLLIHAFKAHETNVEDAFLEVLQEARVPVADRATDAGHLLQLLLRRVPGFRLTPEQQMIVQEEAFRFLDSYEPAARVAARYQNKKKVKTEDGDEVTVYEYSDRQVQNRNREKAERVEKLRKQMGDLRSQVKKDLDAKDPHKRLTALAVALMDETYERVGNEESAEEGHYGVTNWEAGHITFGDGKATIKYVGKSGVKHSKEVTDPKTLAVLRAATKGKGKDEKVLCEGDECDILAADVNEYLKPFDVTAKDIRGLHANEEMKTRLKAVRSKGGKLPEDKKERDAKLKDEFAEALKGAAEAVGHEPSTLRSQYLVPGLEDTYLKDGTVMDRLDKQGREQQPPLGPHTPLMEESGNKVKYRMRANSNSIAVGVYYGRTRIGGMNANVSSMWWADTCADDAKALVEKYPQVEGRFGPKMLSVYQAFITDETKLGLGIGKAMYMALMAEWFDKVGPFLFMPMACGGASGTSSAAKRVWASLARQFPSKGDVVAVLKRPALPAEMKLATKSDTENEDEEVRDLLQRNPTKKPPRQDLRKQRLDHGEDDAEKDPDMSMNYKDIGASLRVAANHEIRRMFRAADDPPTEPKPKPPERKPRPKKQLQEPAAPGPAAQSPTTETPEAPASAAAPAEAPKGKTLDERAKEIGTADFERYKQNRPDTELDVQHFIAKAKKKLMAEGGKDKPAGEDKPKSEIDQAREDEQKARDQASEEDATARAEEAAKKKAIKESVKAVTSTVESLLSAPGSFPKNFSRDLESNMRDMSRSQREAFAQSYTESLKALVDKPPTIEQARTALKVSPDTDAEGVFKDPKAAGADLAATLYADRVTFNPLLIGDKTLSGGTTPMSPQSQVMLEGSRRQKAEAAYATAKDLSDDERQGMADKLSEAYKGLAPDSERAREIHAIYTGLALHAVMDGKDPPRTSGGLKGPKPSHQLTALATALKSSGYDEKMLLGTVGEFTSPKARDAIKDSLDQMSDAELHDFIKDGPMAGLMKPLIEDDERAARGEARRVPAHAREKLREMVTMTIADNVSLMDPMISDYAEASGQKVTQAKQKKILKAVDENPEVKKAKTFLDECMGESCSKEDLERAGEAYRRSRIEAMPKAIQAEYPTAPTDSESAARAKAVAAEGSLDVLDTRIEKSDAQDEAEKAKAKAEQLREEQKAKSEKQKAERQQAQQEQDAQAEKDKKVKTRSKQKAVRKQKQQTRRKHKKASEILAEYDFTPWPRLGG